MTDTISAATDEEVQSGEIGRRLREFNYAYVGEYPATQFIRLNARDAGGSVVGGSRAIVARIEDYVNRYYLALMKKAL